MSTAATAQATQVYQLYIRATPEQVWQAITDPAFITQYFHGGTFEVADGRRRSWGPDGKPWGDEPILEEDPPRRLVHGWRSLYDDDLAAEQTSRVTWEIAPGKNGLSMLTVTHDQLEGAPRTAANVSGAGWMFVLSGLKTLLETGHPMSE